jgi:kynureninase
VTSAQIRAACDLDANTETLGVAAARVGLTRWQLRTELRRRGLIRTHDGHKGAAWNRIPKGVADKIAAMRGER